MSELLRVIVNRQGGTAAAAGEELVQRIVSAFANAGREIDLSLIAGAEMAEAVRRASSESPLVVGGGDGTIGCAAQARVESGGGPLAILPLGTRNHLARELGIPLDLTEAAAVAVGGQPRRIDLASVNGHGFVNNASVGFYPLLVRWREQGRRRGMPKWLATIPASWAALRRFRHHRMHLRVGGGSKLVSTPILFVGNNRYVLERGQLGQRASLDDGLLSVFAVAARSRLGLMWFALRASVGLTDPARDFAALGECRELIVESRSHHIDIALDGEVLRLKPPLRFVVEVGAIEILARP
jgi:diacylglycerol kinase family enzyme